MVLRSLASSSFVLRQRGNLVKGLSLFYGFVLFKQEKYQKIRHSFTFYSLPECPLGHNQSSLSDLQSEHRQTAGPPRHAPNPHIHSEESNKKSILPAYHEYHLQCNIFPVINTTLHAAMGGKEFPGKQQQIARADAQPPQAAIRPPSSAFPQGRPRQ